MKQIVLSIIALCCAPFAMQAQQPQIYTLKSCLEYGLQNNYSLQIVRNEEQVSRNNATPGNAGYLPTLDFTAGKENGVFDQTLNVGLNLNWTIFDGFNITANYQKLKELQLQGETNTRIAIEDLIANLAAEYYNYVQQKIRLQNFRYAVSLSKERLRIVEERYHIGNFSRLDYQQAKVDFNADSAKYMKQQELLHTSRIQLNELMANEDVDQPLVIEDSIIKVNAGLRFEELWNATLLTNASLLKAEQNNTLAMLDYKKVNSRNYPYLKMNTGYGYTFNKYDIAANSQRGNLGDCIGRQAHEIAQRLTDDCIQCNQDREGDKGPQAAAHGIYALPGIQVSHFLLLTLPVVGIAGLNILDLALHAVHAQHALFAFQLEGQQHQLHHQREQDQCQTVRPGNIIENTGQPGKRQADIVSELCKHG